ncbi:hypothetical protein CJ030_MR1G006787 [Morella rubra]|uniref:F-box domain-containing protein n=1 Tax=Morella rubra TaxID=262757 RepID=A0A6A1WS59_9ROSI|nr:hypothetical protein CJ030_MR1G006787 [Morella rubra]
MEHHELPSDILFDIFLRLPVKSLLRFRCVSPQWCNIIDDPCLAYTNQIGCAAEELKVILLDRPTHKPDDVMLREDGGFLKASLSLVTKLAKSKAYVLEGWCKGLVCFTKVSDDRLLFLFNPLRQEVLALQPESPAPSPSLRKRKYGLGFDSSTNTYKIVRVFESPSHNLCAEVYTLGRSSWRAISSSPPCPLFGRPTFACGALHWLASPRVTQVDELEGKIVSFDISKEKFGLISPPKFRSCHLLDLRGDLAVVDRSSDTHIEIWVMKEYEKKEWVKEYKIDLKPPIGMVDNEMIEVIGVWELGEILLRYFGSFLSYDPNTGRLRFQGQ